MATVTPVGSGGIQCTSNIDRPACHIGQHRDVAATHALSADCSARFHTVGGLEKYSAPLTHQAIRADHPTVFDHRTHHADPSTICKDLPEVGSGIVATSNLYGDTRGTGIHELYSITRSKNRLTLRGINDSVVCNLRGNKVNRPPFWSGDRTAILNDSSVRVGSEIQVAR